MGGLNQKRGFKDEKTSKTYYLNFKSVTSTNKTLQDNNRGLNSPTLF